MTEKEAKMVSSKLHRFVATPKRWTWAAPVLILLMGGCAVLTVDVDVYKGPLINEDSVQTDELAVMAMGAKPLLISLRDQAECDWEDDLVKQMRSASWYKLGFCAPDAGKGTRFTNDLAIRINAILSLYENRPPEEPWIKAIGAEFSKYKDALKILRPAKSVVEPVRAQMRKYGLSEANKLHAAFLVFLAPTNDWRDETKIFAELFTNTNYAGYTNYTNAISSTTNPGGGTGRFATLRDRKFLEFCSQSVFPRKLPLTEVELNSRRRWLVDETFRVADSFRQAREGMEKVWRYSLYLSQSLSTRTNAHDPEPVFAHAAELVSRSTHAGHLFALLKATTNDLPSEVKRLQEAIGAQLPAGFLETLSPDLVQTNSKPRIDLQKAIGSALRENTDRTVQDLLVAHHWFATLTSSQFDTFLVNSGLNADKRHPSSRTYGLVEGPSLAQDIPVLLSHLQEPMDELTSGAAGLAHGRLNDGMQTLIDKYLQARHDASPQNDDPEERKARDRLWQALVGFAAKIKFTGDNQVIVEVTKPKNSKNSEPYVMLLQSLGNSILSLVDEARFREKRPKQKYDTEEVELRGLAAARSILEGGSPSNIALSSAVLLTNASLSVDGANAGRTNILIAVNVSNAAHLTTGPEISRELLNALTNSSSALQSLDTLRTALRDLHIAYVASGRSTEARQFEAAFALVEQYRSYLLPLRPPISFLRNATPVTSAQSGTTVGWRNELELQALKSIPGAQVVWSSVSKRNHRLRREFDRQYWQNINQIRLSAAVTANYLVVKDDIGNWYVKGFSANPEAAIKAAKNLAISGAGQGAGAAAQLAAKATNAISTNATGGFLAGQQEVFRSDYNTQTDAHLQKLTNWITGSLSEQLLSRWRTNGLVTNQLQDLANSITNQFTNSFTPLKSSAKNGERILSLLGQLRQFRNEFLESTAHAGEAGAAVSNAVTVTIDPWSKRFLTNRLETVREYETALDVLYRSSQGKR